jgi:hypothetical protein
MESSCVSRQFDENDPGFIENNNEARVCFDYGVFLVELKLLFDKHEYSLNDITLLGWPECATTRLVW